MEDTRYIQFEKYLNNELSNEELISFEEQLKNDTDFNQDFEIYKALESNLSSKFKNEESEKVLKNTLSNLGSKYIKEDSSKKDTKLISLFNYKKLLVAASIAIIVGLFVFKNGDPAYSDFANHTNLELVVRGENNSTISKAEEAFNNKNYKTAFAQLTVLESQFPNDIEIQLYKGICLLELNKYSQAETIFNTISSSNSAFKNKASWYKALNYLKQEKFEDCKNTLQTITEDADEFELATKLLNDL